MGPQVVDAVAVVDLPVLALSVVSTQTVLNHHHGDLVAVPYLVQAVAQSLGIDLPSPVGSLEVGVGRAAQAVACHFSLAGVGGNAVGHIVAEGVEIHRPLSQNLLIAGFHFDLDVVF